MRESSRLAPALALAAAVAAAVAYVTARAVAPGTGDGDRGPGEALVARVERLERALEGLGTARGRDELALLGRIEALEARLAGAPGVPSGPGAAGAGKTDPDRPEAVAAGADEKLRQEVAVGLTTEPASSDHRAALRRLAEHLVKSAGPPLSEKEFAWAAGLLDREARRGRITPQEAAELAPMLAALPVGHAARPAIAKAVAIGWGRDERLGGFLAQFAANAEPSLHQGILAVLDDEHPGPAFSEYVIRLVREERDPAVLAVALGLDRIEAAATAAVAPRLVQAIEARVLDGTLDAATRARAGLAIAVACLRAPETGVATLRRLADAETDARIAEKYRQAAAALQEGDATLKSLERIFQ